MFTFKAGQNYHYFHSGIFETSEEYAYPLIGNIKTDRSWVFITALRDQDLEAQLKKISRTQKLDAELSLYHLSELTPDTQRRLEAWLEELCENFLTGLYKDSCGGVYNEGVSYVLALRRLVNGGTILLACDVAGEYIYENSLLSAEIEAFFKRESIEPNYRAYTEKSSGPGFLETEVENQNDAMLDFISIFLEDDEIRPIQNTQLQPKDYADYEETEYRDEEYTDYPADYEYD